MVFPQLIVLLHIVYSLLISAWSGVVAIVTVPGLVGGAPAGACRISHITIPPSKQNRLGKTLQTINVLVSYISLANLARSCSRALGALRLVPLALRSARLDF